MTGAAPGSRSSGRPGLLLLGLISLGVALAVGWFFRADYYVGRLHAAAAQVEGADTPAHQAELRDVERKLVQLGAPSRGRIYQELSDGSAASLTLDRSLVRCALASYRAYPADDEDELVGAVTLALQRQAGASEGIWDELRDLDPQLWSALACRMWAGLPPAQQRALLARSPLGALREDSSAPRCTPAR